MLLLLLLLVVVSLLLLMMVMWLRVWLSMRLVSASAGTASSY
jgi:hypothetical protein